MTSIIDNIGLKKSAQNQKLKTATQTYYVTRNFSKKWEGTDWKTDSFKTQISKEVKKSVKEKQYKLF